jgi:hypothetical protein
MKGQKVTKNSKTRYKYRRIEVTISEQDFQILSEAAHADRRRGVNEYVRERLIRPLVDQYLTKQKEAPSAVRAGNGTAWTTRVTAPNDP